MQSQDQITRQNFDDWMVPVFSPAAFIPVRGGGSRVWDQQGKEYIDFAGGIAVNSLGHAHPVAVDALTEQAKKLWHVSNIYTNEPVLRLAKNLVDNTFADKVFFCNSGAEANEAALKLARKVGLKIGGEHKNQIVSFKNSFHGRTLFTVTAGGQPKYSQDFAPLPKGIEHIEYNDLAAAKSAITENTCAVIVEPIQGEGGVVPANLEFLQGLREHCTEKGAVLIFDEVQTGVGRTGSLYAYMNTGVTPDILTSAKALGGGFPIGAMLTTDHFANMYSVGDHGTTYGGNPLASAVANAVFEFVNTDTVLQGVKDRYKQFVNGLEEINKSTPVFNEIRGQGLLIGAVLKSEFAGQAGRLMNIASEFGLLVLVAGPNVIRFAPALVISEEEVEEGLIRFAKAVQQFLSAS